MQLYRKRGLYEVYIKRLLDIVCALLILALFWWLYIIIAVAVRVKLGSPIIFKQPRPGIVDQKTGKEIIFNMYKFRTMSNETDSKGELLPDKDRMETFGNMLRMTSLDEILQIFNILKGDMSMIGPRPQLIQDMVFMSEGQRMRHTAKPGLSGLAQVKGRNGISWEDKINWDLQYIKNITFLGDLKIVGLTILKILRGKEAALETKITDDYGDALLKAGIIGQEEYRNKQDEAKIILEDNL